MRLKVPAKVPFVEIDKLIRAGFRLDTNDIHIATKELVGELLRVSMIKELWNLKIDSMKLTSCNVNIFRQMKTSVLQSVTS